MSGSVNQVIIVGNCVRDPEVRSMQNGDKVCNLSVATNERWKNKSGEKQERTEYHRIVIFGNLVGVAERYLSKGSKIYISGKLATRKWQDQSGNDKYSTEVVLNGFDGKMVMLDGPKDRVGQGDGSPPSDFTAGQYRQASGGGGETGPVDLDDDITFVTRWGDR